MRHNKVVDKMNSEMSLDELKRLVRQGEGLHLEFKLKATHPEKIMREVVAFANTEGGHLLIGVNDDLTIPGAKFPDEEIYVMEKALATLLEPQVNYSLQTLPISELRAVLIFYFPKGDESLHYVKTVNESTETKRAYVRVRDRSVQASKEVRDVWKSRNKDQNLRFQYGDKETLLMQHLDEHGNITVAEFATIANVPRRKASRTLVLLVKTNVLRIEPDEIEDRFVARG